MSERAVAVATVGAGFSCLAVPAWRPFNRDTGAPFLAGRLPDTRAVSFVSVFLASGFVVSRFVASRFVVSFFVVGFFRVG